MIKVKWENMEMVTVQAGDLLLTRRRQSQSRTGKNTNKIIFVLFLLLFACCSHKLPLKFFRNMNEYSKFDNVDDRTVLRGIDATIVTQSCKNEYFLSTLENALFNIEGSIFLKDSTIYIRTKNSDSKDSIQILFNFRQDEPKRLYYSKDGISYFSSPPNFLEYSRNEVRYSMIITNMGSRFDSRIDDYIVDFMIRKNENKIGEEYRESRFHLDISLKWGIVNLFYWDYWDNKRNICFVDLINHTFEKKPVQCEDFVPK